MEKSSNIHDAARLGRLNDVEAMLTRGQDPCVIDAETGQNALHIACAAGQVAVAKRLADIAVPILLRDNEGFTPLGRAKQAGQTALLDAFLPEDRPFEAAILLWDQQMADELCAQHGYDASLDALGELHPFYSVDFRPLFRKVYGQYEQRVVAPTLRAIEAILAE